MPQCTKRKLGILFNLYCIQWSNTYQGNWYQYIDFQVSFPLTGKSLKGLQKQLTANSFCNVCKSGQERFSVHCKYLNARSECNDIVISVYSHYPLDPNAKSSDTKCGTLSIRWFCIPNERVMTVYGNYDVIAFKSCIQIFTV